MTVAAQRDAPQVTREADVVLAEVAGDLEVVHAVLVEGRVAIVAARAACTGAMLDILKTPQFASVCMAEATRVCRD